MNEESLFAAALEFPTPAGRQAFLDQVCAGDHRLRRRLEHLLAAEDACGILDRGENAAAVMGAFQPDIPLHSNLIFADRYLLCQKLGEGSMGEVWLAEQQEPVRRRIAVKVIRPGLTSSRLLARFEQERQALALMDHPHIARVLDAGVSGSRPYFVMEVIEGLPITDHCEKEGLSTRERLELFVPVCQAVQHAHLKGIIHRDLKPSNILVGRSEGKAIPKVIDFGVAKMTWQCFTAPNVTTEIGTLVGTLEYMSPEQAELNTADIDTRSDVYSLGVVLYELLTGAQPFSRKQLQAVSLPEMLRIIREVEPTRPSTRLFGPETLPGVSATWRVEPKKLAAQFKGELDWIVMKCLEKDPSRRYETASELALDLRRYLADDPVQARPPSALYRTQKFLRRHRGSMMAVCLVILALVGGMIGTTWGMFRATHAQRRAIHEAEEKHVALAVAQQNERDARDQLFLALLNQARARRYSRQMGQRLESLGALAESARIVPDEQLRDEAIAAMALPDIRRVPGWRSDGPVARSIAYGGSYNIYVRKEPGKGLSIRRIPENQEIQHIDSGPILSGTLFVSPDERYVGCLSEGYVLRLWKVADGQAVPLEEIRGTLAHAFSPDGNLLATSHQNWVVFYDLATGRSVNRWKIPTPAKSLAFHPTNGTLAVGYIQAYATSVFEVATGRMLVELSVGGMFHQKLAWHPDGERLIVGGTEPRVQIWNIPKKRCVALLEGHVQVVTTVTVHPGGDLVATHGWDGHLLLWDPSTGRLLMRLTSNSPPSFSTDGRYLGVIWEDEIPELLEVTPTHEYRTLVSGVGAGKGNYGYYGDISPDGRLLIVGMEEGARIWDLHRGQELVALPAGTSCAFFDVQSKKIDNPIRGLLTCGADGLARWELSSPDSEGIRRIGSPIKLSHLRRAWFTRSFEGTVLGAVTQEDGVNQIVDLETGNVRQHLPRHPQGEIRALSPDGRWAASCGWHSDRVRLWNIETGQMVHEWTISRRSDVGFSPDSRQMVISQGSEFTLWDVETLQLIRRLPRNVTPYPGHAAFSPDGRLLALEMQPGIIHLIEATTGRLVAKLEDPSGDRAHWQGFTPDGTRLVVVAKYAKAIHLWDLHAIRSRLKTMNLDWDWPEFSHGATAGMRSKPFSLQFASKDAPTAAISPEQKAAQDIARFRKDVEQNPSSARACNDLAWAYLVAPDALRQVDAALPLAQKAVELAPTSPSYRNTLGVAYYRAGRYPEAIQILRKNIHDKDNWPLAYDLYFLAMCYHQLGEGERARDFYDWAIQWIATHRELRPDMHEELARFRAELESLLGIQKP